MKMRPGLVAAAMLILLAASPALARNRHHQSSRASHAHLDSQVMRITESPSSDPIVGPPVTVPDGSNYDTPLPKVAAALPPLPTASTVDSSALAKNAAVPKSPIQAAPAAVAQVRGAMSTPAAAPPAPASKLAYAGPPTPAKLLRTPGAVLFDQTHDDSELDPMNWAVSVFKKHHELDVYYKGRLFKKYDAVFGRNLDLGAKLWAQDRRTPEGVYYIVEKYRSVRFRWFLRLNYPNLEDRVRYETMRVNGVIPVDRDGKSPLVGSAIGIHGTDVPILNAGHINWTTGCISLENKDIEDLDRLLPIGTVVIIKP
jgi:hypothetical protein